ncbi:MAG: 4-alpha-glucanotransferase [Gemmatimonadota bacterium]
MSPETTRAIINTAVQYGLEPAWVDTDGRRQVASPEVILAALARLGAPVESVADLDEAASSRRNEIWRRFCPPARAGAPGEATTVPLRIPAVKARGRLRWTLVSDRGRARVGEARVEELMLAGGSSVDGERFEVRTLVLPPDLDIGYHTLRLAWGTADQRVHLVIAPTRAWRSGGIEGGWGLFHPLYGLRTARGEGVGDFRTLRQALEFTSARGGRVFGTTPLLASFDAPPVDPSPYAPASRLFWNDAYVDLEAAPGWAELRERASGGPGGDDPAEADRADPRVPWDALSLRRRERLERLSERFFEAGGAREPDFVRWADARPAAGDYARFRAAREAWGPDWRAWPEPARSGRPPEDALDRRIIRRHLFAQWQADRQMRHAVADAGAALYLDVPLGTSADGYDVWRHRALFVDGVSTGAPPDDFFRGGQDWGLPPLHPERIRENGYAYFGATLRHAMGPAGLVRIDHVMQLQRLYWVLPGGRPTDGVYVRYPAEELAAVLALESHRAECEVVGEDLGTVPPAVRELMDDRGLRRSWVFGFSPGEEPDVPPGAVATLETHDMVPLLGLRAGTDIAERVALGLLANGDGDGDVDDSGVGGDDDGDRDEAGVLLEERRRIFAALDERHGTTAPESREGEADGPDPLLAPLLAQVGRSPAGLVLVSLDDLAGVADPQNVPGTTHERPNWRRRLNRPLESLLGPEAERALEALAAARPSDTGDDA